MTRQERLRVVPCPLDRANRFVANLHRHHQPTPGGRWALAVLDESGTVRGVAIVGRPVARLLDDGQTFEVNRVATDGCPNACSALYGAAARAAAAMGASRILTYTRMDEPGTSLRAAGWRNDGEIRARSWNMPSRPRTDRTEIVRRQRWQRDLAPFVEVLWPSWAHHDDAAQLALKVNTPSLAEEK